MSGLWRNSKAPVNLTNKKKMSGQIDLLAISHEQKTVLVADCKMLHFPHDVSVQKNLVSKFSNSDSEGFYRKLKNKVEWLATCIEDPLQDYTVIQLLIAQRHIPLPAETKRLVLSIADLEENLKEGIPPSEWQTTMLF